MGRGKTKPRRSNVNKGLGNALESCQGYIRNWRRGKCTTDELRKTVTSLSPRLGFVANDVFARSLRAAGANTLLIVDIDANIIRIIEIERIQKWL